MMTEPGPKHLGALYLFLDASESGHVDLAARVVNSKRTKPWPSPVITIGPSLVMFLCSRSSLELTGPEERVTTGP